MRGGRAAISSVVLPRQTWFSRSAASGQVFLPHRLGQGQDLLADLPAGHHQHHQHLPALRGDQFHMFVMRTLGMRRGDDGGRPAEWCARMEAASGIHCSTSWRAW